jgi:hypothetical protein
MYNVLLGLQFGLTKTTTVPFVLNDVWSIFAMYITLLSVLVVKEFAEMFNLKKVMSGLRGHMQRHTIAWNITCRKTHKKCMILLMFDVLDT